MNVFKVRMYDERKRQYEVAAVVTEKEKEDAYVEIEHILKDGFRIVSMTKCRGTMPFRYA